MALLDYENPLAVAKESAARWRRVNHVIYHVANVFFLTAVLGGFAGTVVLAIYGAGVIGVTFVLFVGGCLAINVYAHRRDKSDRSPPAR